MVGDGLFNFWWDYSALWMSYLVFANPPPSPREDLPSALIWSPEIREPNNTSFLEGGVSAAEIRIATENF
jgi:hypothetical protein